MQSKIYTFFSVWIFKNPYSFKKENIGTMQNQDNHHIYYYENKCIGKAGQLVLIFTLSSIFQAFFVQFLNIHKSHSPPRLIPCSSPHDLHTAHRYHWSQSHFQYWPMSQSHLLMYSLPHRHNPWRGCQAPYLPVYGRKNS